MLNLHTGLDLPSLEKRAVNTPMRRAYEKPSFGARSRARREEESKNTLTIKDTKSTKEAGRTMGRKAGRTMGEEIEEGVINKRSAGARL
jgi:hypothetical protein